MANETEQNTGSVYELLVGEGRKFSDQEALAVGKAEADRYIDELRSKVNMLEQENNRFQELDNKLDHLLQTSENQNEVGSRATTDSSTASNTPLGAKDEGPDFEARMEQYITERERRSTQEANVREVSNFLQEKYGEKAGEVFNQTAKSHNMSVDRLSELAKSDPSLVKHLFGVTASQQPSNSVGSTSGYNTEAMGANDNLQTGKELKGMSWFAEQRRKNTWESAKPQFWEELWAAKAAMGDDKFFNS